MTATETPTTTRKVRHPEPSAAYMARKRWEAIFGNLDAMRQRQPIAARVCEVLLVRELAARLAPIMLALMADVGSAPELLGKRHEEGE